MTTTQRTQRDTQRDRKKQKNNKETKQTPENTRPTKNRAYRDTLLKNYERTVFSLGKFGGRESTNVHTDTPRDRDHTILHVNPLARRSA